LLRCRVKESERALIEFKGYSFGLLGLQEDSLKSFQFLNRPGHRRILLAYVKLGNFSSRTLAGIAYPEAHSYKSLILAVARFSLSPSFSPSFLAVVILLRRFNIQVGVSKGRV